MQLNLPVYTLERAIEFTGKGLHSGSRCRVVINPLFQALGDLRNLHIYIRDLHANRCFVLSPEAVTYTRNCTAVGTVHTLEHLLCALFLLSLVGLEIAVEGGEVPALDGGIEEFVFKLAPHRIAIRVKPQLFKKLVFIPKRPIHVSYKGSYAALLPHSHSVPSSSISLSIYVWEKSAGLVTWRFTPLTSTTIVENPLGYYGFPPQARTFGFVEDYLYLRSRNLAAGADTRNTLVLSRQTRHRSRMANAALIAREPAWHKLIDLLGDLYTLAVPYIAGTLVAINPNHSVNNMLARQINKARKQNIL